jgi:ATP-dependent RNA helicase DDX56/DBP9
MSQDAETFESLGLDSRLLQAINQAGVTEPTPIQHAAIPLALKERKDIVARAKTGSGKTAAYLIPIIQRLLNSNSNGNRALVLVPTRELADQVSKVIGQLTLFAGKVVSWVNIAQSVGDQVQASLLADTPNMVVATPARALAHIQADRIDTNKLEFLVLDEADLLASYGYDDDLQKLSERLQGRGVQTFLMSATLSDETETVKSLFCHQAAVLKLADTASADQLLQYYVRCSEQDKFLLAYVIFKLSLIKGKTIIFVNDVDRGYRLKLFFEQFGIKSTVLNAELPVASRLHIVQEFNKGIYQLLIATDESTETPDEGAEEEDSRPDDTESLPADKSEKAKQKKRKRSRDNEYGVSRGVDFQGVSCVLNFDLPTTSRAYTHRIGRTARGRKSGMALSFVVPQEQHGKHKATTIATTKRDEKVLARVMKAQAKVDNELKPYVFDMKQVEAFRYRMEDALRAVTRVAIREARVKEIRQELLASEKLKRHFEENPEDMANLRHDKELHAARTQTHLKRVPEYLLPKSGQSSTVETGFVGLFKKDNKHRVYKKPRSKRHDPLKSFRARR